MKIFVAIFTFTLLFAATSSQPPVDVKCFEENCATEFTGCKEDAQCVETIRCVGKCLEDWKFDPTSQKYIVQNCTNKCTYTYADKFFSYVLLCLSTYDCLHLPETPNTCRGDKINFRKNISFEDVAGTWWTLRGYNLAYDCYPCQKSTLTYTTLHQSFKAFLVGGGLKLVDITGSVEDNVPLPGFNVTLELEGLKSTSTFWPIDIIEDGENKYYLLYYCAIQNQWNYEGAYVVSSATKMSERAIEAARISFKTSLGLNLDTFCSPSTANCTLNKD